MTIDDDVILRVEFLMCAARNVPHRNQFRAFDASGVEFPGFADIEKRESFFAFRHSLHRLGINFVVHQLSLAAATSRGCANVIRLAKAARIQSKNETSRESRA